MQLVAGLEPHSSRWVTGVWRYKRLNGFPTLQERPLRKSGLNAFISPSLAVTKNKNTLMNEKIKIHFHSDLKWHVLRSTCLSVVLMQHFKGNFSDITQRALEESETPPTERCRGGLLTPASLPGEGYFSSMFALSQRLGFKDETNLLQTAPIRPILIRRVW